MIAASLGACVHSETGSKIYLPATPQHLSACFKKAFPDIPDRDLTKQDIVQIIGRAKVLNRVKTACGEQALHWIESVQSSYGKKPGE